MSTFTRLGEMIKNLFSHQKPTSMNNAVVVTAIENTRMAARGVLEELDKVQTKSILGRIAQAIKNRQFTQPMDKQVVDFYTQYVKHLSMPAKSKESGGFLMSLVESLKVNMDDLALVDKNFRKIFGDLKTAEDFKVTHGYVLGYLHLTEMTADLFSDMIYLLNIGKQGNPPKYIAKRIADNLPVVAAFVDMMHNRRSNVTILTEVDRIRKDGTDTFMMVDGRPMSEYTRESDYVPEVQDALIQGLSLNPIMWAGDGILTLQHWSHERRKYTREWMATKIALLNMDLEGKDTTSPEYQEKVKVLNAYTNMIAELDRKIARYENV